MALNSPIDLQLPQVPRLPPEINPAVYGEFQSVYNAIRNLWGYVTVNGGGGGGGDGSWGSITGDISTQLDLMALLGSKITDAPSDSKTYGRKNSTWVEVIAPTVSIVWGDIGGDIANQTDLAARFTTINNNITSITADTSNLWTALSNSNARLTTLETRAGAVDSEITAIKAKDTAQDAAIATKLSDAPVNGQEYVRKNGAWAVATGGGGGVSGVFMPMVTGDKPPVFLYDEDGSLIYAQVA